MEDLLPLKYLSDEKLLCKIDLKDVYFSVLICLNSKTYARITWLGNLHEILCLCFRLGPAPKIVSKLSKVPIEHSSSEVSRRYSFDGKYVRENFNEQKHFDFSASTSGFCYKFEKN